MGPMRGVMISIWPLILVSAGFAQKLHVIDFETGTYNQGCMVGLHPCKDKYKGCDCKVGVSMKVVSKDGGHPVRAGKYSSYHRLANCHERTEWFDKCPLGYEKEIWIGWSMYITKEFTGGGSISQFHDRMGGGGSGGGSRPNPCSGYKHGGPTIFGYGSTAGLAMRHQVGGCTKRTNFKVGPMPKGQWHDLVVNAVFTTNTSKGFFKMWLYPAGSTPGKPNVDYTGSTYWNMKGGGNNGGPVFRTGIYRGNPGKVSGKPVVLYVDEIRWGRASDGASFETVAPGGGSVSIRTGAIRPPVPRRRQRFSLRVVDGNIAVARHGPRSPSLTDVRGIHLGTEVH